MFRLSFTNDAISKKSKKHMIKNESILQLVKFGIVGVFNTLITAIVIWVMLKKLGASDYVSNIVGYMLGLINSFIWNRKWTFESKTNIASTFFKFIITFAICYLLQLGNLYLLLHFTSIDAYISQLLSILVYTIFNFILNKRYTFKNSTK